MKRQIGEKDIPRGVSLVNQFVAAAPVRMNRGDEAAMRLYDILTPGFGGDAQQRACLLPHR